jgi:acetylglutamate kinase
VGTIVVKIGGRAAEQKADLAVLCDEMRVLSAEHRLILVHGGGAEVTAVSRRLGIEAVFHDGVRLTSPEEMDIVDMVLAGKINKQLVRLLRTRGVNAVGLSGSDGGIFTGRAVGAQQSSVHQGSAQTRTGEITGTDDQLLILLLSNGYLPVVSSTSMDAEGRGLNINADAVAFALAARLGASALVFLSDIPGILSEGSTIQALSSEEARALIEKGVIKGGMIPKVTASLEAMNGGVQKVIIGQYEGAGSLGRLLEGKQGTRLWK